MSTKRLSMILLFLFLLLLSSCNEKEQFKNIQSVETLPILEVYRNTAFEQLDLETSVSVTYDDATIETILVDWSNASSTYVSNKDSNIIEGTLILSDNTTNTNQVTVTKTILLIPTTMIDTINSDSSFSIFYEALVTFDLLGLFSGDDVYTVFAPTNEAFSNLFTSLAMTKAEFFADDMMSGVVLNHIVMDEYPSPILRASAPKILTTEEGSNLIVSLDGNTLMVNEYAAINSNTINVTNGILYSVDSILIPSGTIISVDDELFDDELFDTFVYILASSGLLFDILAEDGVTFFIPNEEAFRALAESYDLSVSSILEIDEINNLLFNHIVRGEYVAEDLYTSAPLELTTLAENDVMVEIIDNQLTIGGAVIISAQSNEQFGTIYTIDSVLLTDEIVALLESLSEEPIE